MANSIKDFTNDKLNKMKASGNMSSAKPKDDAAADADDFGLTAAGPSNSSIKFKRGGAVHGKAAKPRLDRKARKSGGMCETGVGERKEYAKGGRVKGKTNINIIIGGDKGQQQPQAMPVPVPMPTGGPPQGMPQPKPPMPVMPVGGAPMGAGAGPSMAPGPMGAGMPPMGRKRGGRVHKADGGMIDGSDFKEKYGSRSGEARLAKSRSVTKGGMAP